MSAWHVNQAVSCMGPGAVIAYPTEAVYGLGCDPWDSEAVTRIFKLKRRPQEKGLIIIGSDIDQLSRLVEMPENERLDEILASWPGPVTWVLPALESAPDWLKSDTNTLAVRIPGHDIARQLCEAIGPLISTSANISGQPPARDPETIRKYFGDELDYVVPGEVDLEANPSQIRDGKTGTVIRG